MARLFVLTWPPPEVVAAVLELERPTVARMRWSVPEQWKVVLRPLGHVDDDLVAPLGQALAEALAGAGAVRCTLGPATQRFSGWLSVPVSGLDGVSDRAFAATVDLVPVTHPQPFHGHLMLATGKVPKQLGGVPLTASWSARQVALVADRSSPRGPRYEDLAIYELGGISRGGRRG